MDQLVRLTLAGGGIVCLLSGAEAKAILGQSYRVDPKRRRGRHGSVRDVDLSLSLHGDLREHTPQTQKQEHKI